jgi:urease accessory protein
MPRTQRILGPGEPRGEIADTLLLKFEDRRRQQGFAFGGKGTCVEFDFPAPPRLRTDDLLVLDDGRLVEVVADAEPVLEVRATDFAAIARLILALDNRHLSVQVLANRVRVLRTAQTEALVAAHGIEPALVLAPFEPDEETAHDQGHDHGHGHEHGNEHGHAHRHGHGHEPEHGHDHGHEHSHRPDHGESRN